MRKLVRLGVSILFALSSIGHAQQLTVAQGTGPETLDAQRSTVQQTLNVSQHINEALLRFDYQQGGVVPLLASSFEPVSDDVWEFKLRDGVSFTNGEPFNADTVKFSVERIASPELNAPGAVEVRAITEIEVVDDLTVRFHTDGPSPTLPLNLTRVAMVPPGYIGEVGNAGFGQNPVGTGPFQLERWVRGDRVVLSSNSDYWGGTPTLEQVTFVAVPEEATRMAALQSGEVDIAVQVSIEQAPLLERMGFAVEAVPSLRIMMVALPVSGEENVYRDQRVRQALNYAVDKESLVTNILGGYGEVIEGQPLSSEYFGFNPEVAAYPFDPERARELLEEAGYGEGNPLEISLYGPQGRYTRDSEILQAIGGNLRNVGVNADVQVLDWSLFIERLVAKDFDGGVFWGATTVPDGGIWQSSMLASGAAYSLYANAEIDEMLEEAGRTVDSEQRLAIYQDMAEKLHDEAPFIYLYQQVDLYGVAPSVSGWTPSPDESIYLWGVAID